MHQENVGLMQPHNDTHDAIHLTMTKQGRIVSTTEAVQLTSLGFCIHDRHVLRTGSLQLPHLLLSFQECHARPSMLGPEMASCGEGCQQQQEAPDPCCCWQSRPNGCAYGASGVFIPRNPGLAPSISIKKSAEAGGLGHLNLRTEYKGVFPHTLNTPPRPFDPPEV